MKMFLSNSFRWDVWNIKFWEPVLRSRMFLLRSFFEKMLHPFDELLWLNWLILHEYSWGLEGCYISGIRAGRSVQPGCLMLFAP